MPEINKGSQGDSPVARTGGGDISERELSRERYNLQTTPPSRVQPAHPKKQLLSAPVNKFTAQSGVPNTNLARIRSCLDQYSVRDAKPARKAKIGPKCMSMEDLTPKRVRRREDKTLPKVRSPLRPGAEEAAAGKICRFMLLHAWRRKRKEVRCLKKTLEFQVSGSERLRIQVCALKSLLDSDNAKVRLAIKELERLKQLLHDKELEKQVLEREKTALEADISATEDRASQMSIGWHNCRNELESARAAGAVCEHALSLERAASAEARAQRDQAYTRLSLLEEEIGQYESLLAETEAEVSSLRRESTERQKQLDDVQKQLASEQESLSRCSRECGALSLRMSLAAEETRGLRAMLGDLQGELVRMDRDLRNTREQLDWWPRPLTRMLGAARSLFSYPKNIPDTVLWSLIPARHGC